MKKIEECIETQKKRLEQSLAYKVYDLHVDLTENFLEQLEGLGLTQKQLAERAGLKSSYVNRVLNNPANLTIETIVKLAEALDLEVKVLLKKKKEQSWMNFSGEVYEGFKKIVEAAIDEVIESSLKTFEEKLLGEKSYTFPRNNNVEPEEYNELPFAA